jgi:hypothetical protein
MDNGWHGEKEIPAFLFTLMRKKEPGPTSKKIENVELLS